EGDSARGAGHLARSVKPSETPLEQISALPYPLPASRRNHATTAASMTSPQRLSAMIHAIYGAAENPERWEDFLQMVAEEVRAGMTVRLALDRSDAAASIATSVRANPEAIELYNSSWGSRDPWANSGHESLTREGAITITDELVPERDLLETPFYNDFAR